jgi:hypothetical protein
VGYCATRLLALTLRANVVESAPSAITFFEIFLSFALFICLVAAVLHFFGTLVIELFGILDERVVRTNDRYARN